MVVGGAICFVIDHICNTDLTELEETQALPKIYVQEVKILFLFLK